MSNERIELVGGNCTFEYNIDGKHTFIAPIRGVGHSFEIIATESKARVARGFYPHQRAEGQFAIQLDLKGYPIFRSFMSFMQDYVHSSNSQINRGMSVWVPSHDFWRIGVPVGGIEEGDHVGSNLFQPVIIFESAIDPLDPLLITGVDGGDRFSRFDENGSGADEAARFFYPAAALTNDPNAQGENIYDDLPTPPPSKLLPGKGPMKPI
jgi:hypothetical protein